MKPHDPKKSAVNKVMATRAATKAKPKKGKFAWFEEELQFLTPKQVEKLENELVQMSMKRGPLQEYDDTDRKFLSWQRMKDKYHGATPEHKLSTEAKVHHEKWHNSLNDNERKALSTYKGAHHEVINSHLRTKRGKFDPKKKAIAAHIKALDHVTSNPTNEDMHVYRGFGHTINHKKFKPGAIVKDHGYTSTSHSEEIAHAFTHGHEERDKVGTNHVHIVMAKIHVPKGTKAHFVDTASATHTAKSEKEMLLHRGTSYRVKSVETHHLGPNPHNNKHYHHHIVHMEVYHQEDHTGDHAEAHEDSKPA